MMMPPFERPLTHFGLLQDNKWLICILPDEKLTVHEQKEVIALTGTELVKVHAVRKFTMTKIINRTTPSKTAVDEKVINRKNAFKAVKPEKLNKPIPVEFTPNITIEVKSTIKTTLFCNPQGEMYDMPEGLASDEIATIAKLVKAEIVLAEFEVVHTLLNKASPFRSQSQI